MFILNAFCCGSQQTDQKLPAKLKITKRVTLDQTNSHLDDSSSPLQITTSGKQEYTSLPVSQFQTPTFPQPFNVNQTYRSDQCNISSKLTSLEEEVSEQYVSSAEQVKFQSSQKENDYLSMRNYSFYSCDSIKTEVKQWSIKEVLKFLGQIGMKQYHNTFYQNKIKGKDLISLSEKQLQEDLKIEGKDVKIISSCIQFLKQKSEKQKKQKKQKELSRSFSRQRRQLSLYKSHSNTYSCRKILSQVKNPIVEQECEEDNCEHYGKKNNFNTNDNYSTSNFSELLTN